jgi:hypothetical protein
MVKITEILFLSLFLASVSLSEELILYESEGKAGSVFYLEYPFTKLKNAKIELEFITKHSKNVPDKSHRRKDVLGNKMKHNFLNEINEITLINTDVNLLASEFCYNINIYDNENLIVTFETNGRHFYDRKNKLLYALKDYERIEYGLLKYWNINEPIFVKYYRYGDYLAISDIDVDVDSGVVHFKKKIMHIVNVGTPQLERIYKKYLEQKPDFSGKVTLKIIISSSNIADISIVSSTTGYPEFDSAIKNFVAFLRWKIIKDMLKDSNAIVTIPLNFAPDKLYRHCSH